MASSTELRSLQPRRLAGAPRTAEMRLATRLTRGGRYE
jgi:hypothetical protein